MSVFSVREMLESLNASELKEALLAMNPDVKLSGTKEQTIGKLLDSGSVGKVEQVAAKAECLAPFKHSWVFRLEPEAASSSSETAQRWSKQLWHNHFVSVSELDRSSNDLQPTLQIHDTYLKRVYVKFTHWISSRKYEQVDPYTRKLQEERIQHSVVALLRADIGTLEVRFDGFKQGRSTRPEDKIGYDWIAQTCKTLISERLQRKTLNTALDRAATYLSQEKPEEVKEVGRNIVTAEGRVSVRNNESDIGGDVISLLSSTLNNVVRTEDLKEALKNAPADALWHVWQNHEIVTRISKQYGAFEILFIWKGNKTNSVTDSIIRSLIEASTASENLGTSAQIRTFVENLKPSQIVLLSDVANRFDSSYSWVLSILEASRRVGTLERKYRVKTENQMQDFHNTWRSGFDEFPEAVHDEDGNRIDLKDPSNIEVGYCRL